MTQMGQGLILDFYRHLIDSEKRLRKLPPVFPILLYNGKRRWTSPLNLAELVEGHELLGEHTLHFKYFPITGLSEATILKAWKNYH